LVIEDVIGTEALRDQAVTPFRHPELVSGQPDNAMLKRVQHDEVERMKLFAGFIPRRIAPPARAKALKMTVMISNGVMPR
jgi:hypothetical protein